MSIIVENLCKSYGNTLAVNNINFNIGSGEIVGFLGPNGAGKSTTMKMITGCISIDSGSATVNGFDCAKQMEDIKRTIGYLPENNPLYPNMYVKEYLEYCAGMYLNGGIGKAVANAVDATGLGVHQYKRCGELSKGYKQRVGLARALVHNPMTLILDEPTTGLDPNQIIGIRKLIKQLGREKTVILSTHIMQEAEAVCSRAIIINKGVIVADDSLDNLKHSRKNAVVVEFDTPLPQDFYKGIEGCTSAVNISGNKWRIIGNEDTDLRKQVFNFAVSNNKTVLSLNKDEDSLEGIFRQLTK